MTSESENEKIFEAILASAFRDAVLLDIEEAGHCEPVRLSKKHLREERRAYNHYKLRIKWSWATENPVIRKVAAVILIVGCVGFAGLVSMPEVRAAVGDAIVRFCEKYVALDFVSQGSKSANYDEYTYTFGYIPKGFRLTEESGNIISKRYRFENDEGEWFSILYSLSSMTVIQNDIEHSEYSETMVNGYKAYLFRSSEDGQEYIRLIFDDGTTVFQLSGNIPESELKKNSEKISK